MKRGRLHIFVVKDNKIFATGVKKGSLTSINSYFSAIIIIFGKMTY